MLLSITCIGILKNGMVSSSNANIFYLHRILQSQMLSERRTKKKKTGKVKKTEPDKDQNQNTNHLRKRLERILYVFKILEYKNTFILYSQNTKWLL